MKATFVMRAACILVWGSALAARACIAAPAPDFEKEVGPIFLRHCLSCHNPGERKGGLDLSRREAFAKGGDSGPVVLPGDLDGSYLLERVAEGSMPPPKAAPALAAAEIKTLRAWVAAGAAWPEGRVLSPFEQTTDRRAGFDWWSLQPLARPVPPALRPGETAHNPIDAFVWERLRARGLALAPPAERRVFLRRAKFDLLGLPPTPDEIEEFLADRSPLAYERLIDRLLASPHYGERWGRHWLDVARFGESDGFEHDKARDHAWRYRDYVVESLNADLPYDQFVVEQLAGDARPPISRSGIAATGFLVAGPWDEIQNVGKSQAERMRTHEEQLEELLGAVSQTFLGLTVNCARCHDHKFDPIPQADYYRLKAVFDGVDHGNRPLFTPDEMRRHEALVAPLQKRVADLKAELARLESAFGSDALVERPDPPPLAAGRFGQALDPRKSRVSAADKPVYHAAPLTVECWARLESKTGFNILVACHPKESADHWELYSYAGSGEFSAYLPGYSPAEIKSGVEITDGRWRHVAMHLEANRVRLFVDGKLVKEAAIERKKSGGPAGPLYLGSYPPQGIGCDGLIDEVRISNVLREFAGPPEAPPAADEHTLALWRFDELAENRVADAAPVPIERLDLEAAKTRRLAVTAELKAAEGELAAQVVPQTYSGVRRQPPATVVYLRGDIKQPGEQVSAGGLSAIRGLGGELGLAADAPEAERRLRFARWVVDPANPLAPRAIVNRVWHYHFGRGLIETPSDLGFNGGLPSHPELLDWLAGEFTGRGAPQQANSSEPHAAWSLKRLHRLIMLSAAYRQSAVHDERAAELDAENRLLWRFAPRRLEAEAVRDAMLAVSGELNAQLGGPSFRPFTVTVFNTHFYHLFDRGEPQYNRRGIYRMQVNTAKSPLLDALDCPAPSLSAPQRRVTTTPLQALALMNDSFVMRQAERLAKRLEREVPQETPERAARQIERLFVLALGRPPEQREQADLCELAAEHGLPTACWTLLNTSEFLFVW